MKISDFFINSSDFFGVVKYNFLHELNLFIFGESRLGLKLLTVYVLISFFLYVFSNLANRKMGVRGFFEFVFPKKIYLHASSKMDFKVFFARIIFNPSKLITLSMVSVVLSKWVSWKLESVFPPSWEKFESNGFNLFLISLTGSLIYDFNAYLIHRFFHNHPFIWPFHSPHHSAELLNPFTGQRDHFVYEFTQDLSYYFFMGLAQGVLIWASLGAVNSYQIFEFTFILSLINYIVGNFQHSHFWISFGFLDRIIISPAMHQIHHSSDRKHRNKNFGVILSIWDLMFGTIYLPKEKEQLSYGIDKGIKNPHDTLLKFYFLPFKESSIILKNKIQNLWKIPISVTNKFLVKD